MNNAQRLQESLAGIEDARQEWKVLHPLENVLLIGFAAILCGGESFEDMERFGEGKKDFFVLHLDMGNGVPLHDTFRRVFEMIRSEELLGVLRRYGGVEAGEQVCLDGKALRGGKVQVLNAYAREKGLALGQLEVDGKTNEITVLPEMIRSLELGGTVVSVDAMGCQKNVAKEIVEADADYVLALKGNAGLVCEEVKDFFEDALRRGELAVHEEHDKGHGRLERRRYWQSEDISWLADLPLWEGLRSVAMVESERRKGECLKVERRYYLSSLPFNLPRIAELVRGHWAIENSLHWVMDVTFGEDRNNTRLKRAAENLALMRRLALNICKLDSSVKDSIKGKRFRAACSNHYLSSLLNLHA